MVINNLYIKRVIIYPLEEDKYFVRIIKVGQ